MSITQYYIASLLQYMNNCLVVSYILRTFGPDLRRIQSKLLVAFCDVDDLYIASEYIFWGPTPSNM